MSLMPAASKLGEVSSSSGFWMLAGLGGLGLFRAYGTEGEEEFVVYWSGMV